MLLESAVVHRAYMMNVITLVGGPFETVHVVLPEGCTENKGEVISEPEMETGSQTIRLVTKNSTAGCSGKERPGGTAGPAGTSLPGAKVTWAPLAGVVYGAMNPWGGEGPPDWDAMEDREIPVDSLGFVVCVTRVRNVSAWTRDRETQTSQAGKNDAAIRTESAETDPADQSDGCLSALAVTEDSVHYVTVDTQTPDSWELAPPSRGMAVQTNHCPCCGDLNHHRRNCYHKDKYCARCNKRGHVARMCYKLA